MSVIIMILHFLKFLEENIEKLTHVYQNQLIGRNLLLQLVFTMGLAPYQSSLHVTSLHVTKLLPFTLLINPRIWDN